MIVFFQIRYIHYFDWFDKLEKNIKQSQTFINFIFNYGLTKIIGFNTGKGAGLF
jgi:hypothetical protein